MTKIYVAGGLDGNRIAESCGVDLAPKIEDAEILVTRSKTKVNKELVDKMPYLKYVITATHGIDNLDTEYLTRKGIEFHPVPAQSYDVAQGVIGYILAHATNLVEGDRSMKRGEWKKKEFFGHRINEKTLGIIGCGKIGRNIKKMASALGMDVVTFDACVETEESVSFEELLRKSDYVTVNVPRTKDTINLIGKEEIEIMKEGAYIINTARGGIVDEKALLEAIDSEKLSGAALDVFKNNSENNLPFGDNSSGRLIAHEKVIATPHSIGQSQEAVDDKHEGVIRIIKNYISNNNKIESE
ncbi:MAG: NAD(P)-dependent oxidoreductase [Candidatus Aenigmatarchaeota archaeon]